MRLICLHTDTVDALQKLGTSVEDLTPKGLWDTPFHLVTVSPEQREALQQLRVTLDDVTPTALRDFDAGSRGSQTAPRATSAEAVASPS
jgi:hypothetical protein